MLSTLAFYLPQFHRIPENDKWWGEGFTEWTAVKGAEPLFAGHRQPRIPLGHNYYDLLDHDTFAWQAGLMHKYRIDGMCIYHYWFEDGKRILEKPAENLLGWDDIEMPFCFCWANETWSRTWKKLAGANSWSSIYETAENQKGNGILMKQSYGREEEWEEHFQYLLPFFRDGRYIKWNGRPVFAILKPSDIYSLGNMMEYFNARAIAHGFLGVYVIGMEDERTWGVNAVCARQPLCAILDYTCQYDMSGLPFLTFGYDKIWNLILQRRLKEERTYLCGVVDFDRSPRMGKRGYVLDEASPQKFYAYFKELYRKSLQLGNEFLFLNAWNEWGESMYLEPDEENGYGYLEAVRRVAEEYEGASAVGNPEEAEKYFVTEAEKSIRSNRNRMKILQGHDKLLDDWLYLREMQVDFGRYFRKHHYREVAIYGMGKLGRHLLYELRKGGIKVSYAIDREEKESMDGVTQYRPWQQLPETDAVVMTVTGRYEEICKMLGVQLKCAMVTIEEVIQELIPDR